MGRSPLCMRDNLASQAALVAWTACIMMCTLEELPCCLGAGQFQALERRLSVHCLGGSVRLQHLDLESKICFPGTLNGINVWEQSSLLWMFLDGLLLAKLTSSSPLQAAFLTTVGSGR